MQRIVILALPGVLAFDLATPMELFGRTRVPGGDPAYHVRVCAPTDVIDAGLFTLRVPWDLTILAEADTIILPGLADPTAPLPAAVCRALQDAAARGARLASICVGAFTLAATGLLDGRRATTHWAAADALARRYPAIQVDANVLFVDTGQFATSAGAAAGIDLCLHLIRRDYGAAVAAATARAAVMPLERAGGQAQFIVHAEPPPAGTTLEPLLHWMEANLGHELTLDALAHRMGMSTRTFSRHFREQTGSTPMQWLHRCRLRQAQSLLETTGLSIEQIGSHVGFGSSTTFRDRFKQLVGVSPQAYRQTFRGERTQ